MKMKNTILKMLRYSLLLCVIVFGLMTIVATNGGDGGGGNGDDTDDTAQVDPYEGLMDVDKGEIAFEGEYGCFKRCDQKEGIICVTTNTSEIIASLNEGREFTEDCDQLIFPEWFYQYDCHIATGGKNSDGTSAKYNMGYNEESETFLFFVQCFCGRTSSTYSSEYSLSTIFKYHGCGETLEWRPLYETLDTVIDCSNPCNLCEPNCTVRECGNDGCGGSCGICPDGKECNAAGQCVSEVDTCTSCLATCSGLPGCCTGCGCMCEDECGHCF